MHASVPAAAPSKLGRFMLGRFRKFDWACGVGTGVAGVSCVTSVLAVLINAVVALFWSSGLVLRPHQHFHVKPKPWQSRFITIQICHS